MKEIKVGKNQENKRLSKLLEMVLKNAGTGFIYKMLRKKNITLNDKKATGKEILAEGDVIRIYLSDDTFDKFSGGNAKADETKPSLPEADIIYEDEHVIFANKKAGILSQKATENDISINEMLIDHMVKNGELSYENLNVFKPSVANRLDRNTSGIIVFGKTLNALKQLGNAFKNRTIDKYYLCIVCGNPDFESKELEGYLYKNEAENKVIISNDKKNDDFEYIHTGYRVLKRNGDFALLEIKLYTGKPHQIRAHLSSIGHPILGDYKYGDKKINDRFKKDFGLKYQLLHAERIVTLDNSFADEMTSLNNREFKAKLPEAFIRIKSSLFGGE